MTDPMHPRRHVYVLLLNWNGYRDTVGCLESLLKSTYEHFTIVVCDNASTDGSMDVFKRWSRGECLAEELCVVPGEYRTYFSPPHPKPIEAWFLEEKDLAETLSQPSPNIIFISNPTNMGFAAGNNVGLRYILNRSDAEYVWILNNDTLVEPQSLSEQLQTMLSNPRAGICGSTVKFLDGTGRIQAYGYGKFYSWFATSKDVRRNPQGDRPVDNGWTLLFVSGASMFVRCEFLRRVGLMCEDYFLFFEEPDWSYRSRGFYELAYSERSVVYHKVGASRARRKETGVLSDYYRIRNRILFARKHYPVRTLCLVYPPLAYEWLKRVFRREFKKARNLLKIVVYSFFHWDLTPLKPTPKDVA